MCGILSKEVYESGITAVFQGAGEAEDVYWHMVSPSKLGNERCEDKEIDIYPFVYTDQV